MKENKWLKAVAVMLSAMIAIYPVADVYAALNIKLTSTPVTVEAVVAGSNVLSVTLKNASNDGDALKVAFANTTRIGTASQYLEVAFKSIEIGARVIIRTDNRNATPSYTGTGSAAGLVGNTDRTTTAPLLWAVFDDVTSAKAFVFKGDTDPSGTVVGTVPGAEERGAGEAEGLIVDKTDTDYESTTTQNYATVVVPNGESGLMGNFPVDADGAGPSTGMRACTSPVYVVIGAGFQGKSAQTYSTNTLALDLIAQ